MTARKFHWYQAKWLIRCVLRGHCSPRTALRTYRNTTFIRAYAVGNPPPPGDTVWGHCEGADFTILGRHVIPNPDGPVIL